MLQDTFGTMGQHFDQRMGAMDRVQTTHGKRIASMQSQINVLTEKINAIQTSHAQARSTSDVNNMTPESLIKLTQLEAQCKELEDRIQNTSQCKTMAVHLPRSESQVVGGHHTNCNRILGEAGPVGGTNATGL